MLVPVRPAPWKRYGVAVVAVIAATAATQLLTSLMSVRFPSALFFVAVVGAAWYGGVRAGLLAAVLAVFSIAYFIVPPAASFAVDLADWLAACALGAAAL